MPTLQIELLGGFAASYDGAQLNALNTPRLRMLLASLSLAGTSPQPRARLAFRLWPDVPEARANGNLRRLLHRLRQILPQADRLLEFAPQSLGWRADALLSVDVAAFEAAAAEGSPAALERAVELYRGELLPDDYDDWLLAERERLHGTLLDAGERLVQMLEELRAYQRAIHYAERLLRYDPLGEGWYRRLMRLHALNGDRARALVQFERCVAMLREQLDAEPSRATREAHAQLLRVEQHAVTGGAAPQLPLIGRDAAWRTLQHSWRATGLSGTRLVLISGSTGVGKTRLLEELSVWAKRQGIAQAVARCAGAERDLAYGPLTTLLRALPAPAHAPAWQHAEVARLVPPAGDTPVEPPGPLTEPWQRQRFIDALAAWVLVCEPVLLGIDDLHHCDAATLAWLHYLATRRRDARVMLVCTLNDDRTDELPEFAPLLETLRRDGRVDELQLGPLDAAETAALANAAGARLDAGDAERLYRDTEGNALFILETLRTGTGEHMPRSPSIRAAIETRLTHLSRAAQHLAGLAATIGRAFSLEVLQAAWDAGDAPLADSLDELTRRHIVREQSDGAYDFEHGRLAEAAYNRLGTARRRHYHARIAQALERLHLDRYDDVAAVIARHFEAAARFEHALPYHLHAAAVALRLHAPEIAAGHFARLLQPPYAAMLPPDERADIQLQLGAALQLRGRWDEAEDTFRAASAEASAPEAAPIRARLQVELGSLLLQRGRFDAALAALETAHTIYEILDDRGGVSVSIGHIGKLQMRRGNYAEAFAAYRRQLDLARTRNDRAGVGEAVGNIGTLHLLRGEYAQAMKRYRQKLAIAAELGDRESLGNAAVNIGILYDLQGDYARATICQSKRLQLALELGNLWSVALGAGNLAITCAKQGAFAEAQRLYDGAAQIGRTLDSGWLLSGLLHNYACLWVRRADRLSGSAGAEAYGNAQRLNDEALTALHQVNRPELVRPATVLQLRLKALLGELDAATAATQLHQLLDRHSDAAMRAEICYEAWRLNGDTTDRDAAADWYLEAYRRTSNAEYGARYHELTGKQLPRPAPLPDIPQLIDNTPPLASLLAAFDALLEGL